MRIEGPVLAHTIFESKNSKMGASIRYPWGLFKPRIMN